MALIVKRLVINNFKIFESLDLSVESDHLIVLDGPNGFGKSSFFDALELLLTGSIRRYIELETLTIDGRSLKPGCPWLYNQAKAGAWLSIRAEVMINEQTKFLERAACKVDLDRNKGLKGLKLPLYELSTLEADRSAAIPDEESYLSELLGAEYKRDFELFHYVEQEENTRLLKQKEKDRQQQIAHLFEIGEIQQRINNINQSHTKIGKLCGPQQKREVTDLESKWAKAKQQLLPDEEPVGYQRLVEMTNQSWDREIVEYEVEQFEEWLSPDGELFRIGRFIKYFSQYENQLYNDALARKLLPQPELQQRMLTFVHRVPHLQMWKQEVLQYDAAERIIIAFQDVLEAVKNNKLILPSSLTALLPDTVTPSEFEHQVTLLKQQITSADKLDKSLVGLVLMREQLVRAFKQFHLHGGATESCPTCGHNWESFDVLLEEIEKQGETLKLLAEQQDSQLAQQLADFKLTCQDPVEQKLSYYLQQQQGKVAYKRQLVTFSQEQIFWLDSYAKQLTKEGIEFQDLLLKNYDLNAELPLPALELRVRSKFKPVDESCLYPDFDHLYTEVFKKDPSAVKQVKYSQIENKITYLRQQQSLASSKYAIACGLSYKKANQEVKSATKLKKHLRRLKDIYESEKKSYLESIVKEIEILFHIYSGRLMQSYQQGLGIFIENDGNSIAFHEKPGQDHDVVFSMSSGQLSALVLSFTLALNQRYAKHTLLLIDDPVQTLDEINVAGFVELLRTEFASRQVIISTHEDHMSAYFRYKYKKFGMPVGRINFMEQARAAIDIE
ncbi:AAA family ATPase [Oceanisphaera ostreae]|uniref:AAA family ATPase n=1 Tax=Oceanisphaera ostreae TaxID=914151 RepID=A0ABW3KKS0_9GAMM